MSRILLVIGLATSKSDAIPELVYLGRSGEAMRQAIATATHPRLVIVPHVTGIPKNNPRHVANTAVEQAKDVETENWLKKFADAADKEKFAAIAGERDELARLLVLAEDSYRAQSDRAEALIRDLATRLNQLETAQRELATAREELAKLKAPAPEAPAVEPAAPAPLTEVPSPEPTPPDPAPPESPSTKRRR